MTTLRLNFHPHQKAVSHMKQKKTNLPKAFGDSQDDLNNYPVEYLLYYLNVTLASPTIYVSVFEEVCAADYNIETKNFEITDWYLDPEVYPEPSMETLIAFNVDTVLAWYKNFYTDPQAVIDTQAVFKISAVDLAALVIRPGMQDFIVYETDASKHKYLVGTTWANCFA
jgi:hypothetical protein